MATFPLAEGARRFREPLMKRLFDLVLSAIVLLFSLPLWVLFSLWIWLEDGRPIFYYQKRTGRNGRVFPVRKFRSMIQDASRTDVQAQKDDPRFTRVGRFLRMTAMDELPQVWSIFKGDMSFVGPRSQPEKEFVIAGKTRRELHISQVPGYELRQMVRPGLTGVAQVFASRKIPHRYKFKLDLVYVRRIMGSRGFLGDLQLFFYDLGLILRSIWISLRARWEV